MKALLKIWYKCNYTCNFCHAEFKKSLMTYPLKIFYLKILLLKKKGVKTILTTGWESTLEKHFFQIVSFIKKQGLDFGIVTNGSTICNKKFLDKLDKLGIKNIYLSLHGFGDTHNNIVGDKNGYNKVVRIIKDLKQRKHILLFLNYVVTRENVSSIEKTVSDISKIWYVWLGMKFSMLEPEGIWKDDNLMIEPVKSWFIIKSVITEYKWIMKLYWDWYPLCLFRNFLNKRADLQTENIKYITEVYENKIYNTDYGDRKYYKECNSCDLKNNCYWIFSYYTNIYRKEDNIIF